MSYVALYRKFRPSTFDEVKGQDHIVKTLKNQMRTDRLGHAYLFCGTRGTGKTSVAKILAKAVNCEHPVDVRPANPYRPVRRGMSSRSMRPLITVLTISVRSVRKWPTVRQRAGLRCTSSMRCTCCPRGRSTHC